MKITEIRFRKTSKHKNDLGYLSSVDLVMDDCLIIRDIVFRTKKDTGEYMLIFPNYINQCDDNRFTVVHFLQREMFRYVKEYIMREWEQQQKEQA